MKVQEIVDLVKIRCPNIVVSTDNNAVINLINIAVIELYRRFNLKIKSETVVTTDDLALYTLRNNDVDMIVSVSDKFGREFKQSDTSDSMEYDYKLLNYRTILLRKPMEGYIYVIYKASPIALKDVNDEIDIPDAMLDALLTYISYMLSNTVNQDNKNEASMFYQMFEKKCQELDSQGYKVPLFIERPAIQVKGYV